MIYIKRLYYLVAVALGVVASCFLLELSAPKAEAALLSDSYNGVTFQEIYDFSSSHNIVSKNDKLIISVANNGSNINGKPAFYVNYITSNSTSIPFVQTGSFYKSSNRFVQNYYTVYWSGSQWTYQGINNNTNDNIWLYLPSGKTLDQVVYTSCITITFNGSDIVTPPPAYVMNDYVNFYSSGAYDFNLDVRTTADSIYYSKTGSYVTDRYIAYLAFNITKNNVNTSYTYLLPTYKTSFPYKTSYNGISVGPLGADWYSILYQDSVATFTRTCSNSGLLWVTDNMLESGTPLNWNEDEAMINTINNRWTLRQLFDVMSTDYPSVFTDLSDMFVNYHYFVYDCDVLDSLNNPVLAFEGDIDYSSGKVDEVPEDDKNILNLTNTVNEVINQMGGVQYYLSTLTGKSTYNFKNYEKDNLPDFMSIDNPNYNYDTVQLDSDSMSWFSWLVHYLYIDSPIGIFLMLALGILVCRMVLW